MPASLERLKQRPHVKAGRRQQGGGERAGRIERRGSVPSKAGPRDDPSHQRKSVGVNAGRGQTEHKVAGLKSWPGQEGPALGGADREARDVEIAGSVKAWHLRGLAADQRAAGLRAPLGDALHNCRRDFVVKFAGCKIVQEKQWLRALNDNVVDAHGDQVNSDAIIDAALDGDLHLRADAVVGGDQDRVDEAGRLEVEQSANPPSSAVGPERRVARANGRIRSTIRLPTSMSTPKSA